MLFSAAGLAGMKASLQNRLLLGHKLSPELIAIILVYFVQGILGLAHLAISFFLKDDLGLTPAQVASLMGISMLPWVMKPLFGFLSDGLPLFGYRRRSYLFLSGLVGMLSWVLLATMVDTIWAATGAIALSSLSIALSDVIADSIVVERARQESLSQAGSLQSLCWGASAFGGLLTAYLSGWLLGQVSSRTVFLITALFPLLISAVAWLIVESPARDRADSATVRHQMKRLRQAISQKPILLPIAFLFLWQATPSSDSAFFFFSTNDLGFEPEFLGRIRLVTSLATLLGVWIFQRFLRNVPLRPILGWSTVLSALLGMTTLLLVTHVNRTLGINDYWFSLGDSLILRVMGEIAFLPFMVLAARLCPPDIEATFFALLMSIWNLGWFLSQQMSALLTHLLGITETQFDNLWLLVLIANVSTLLPLVFLQWVPDDDPQKAVEAASAEIPGQSPTPIDDETASSLKPLFPEAIPIVQEEIAET